MTVVEIKAEIFDIIDNQENLQREINHLEQLKQQKIQELQVEMNKGSVPDKETSDMDTK